MDVITAVQKRRATKSFDPHHPLSPETRRVLLETAALAPSAYNIQHWRILDVQDPQLRSAIREVAWGQAQVTDASALFVLCADLKAWEESPARYWATAPQPVQDFLLPKLDEYYRGKAQVARDEAMRSLGIFGMTLMLVAQDLGLDSCPMDGFDFDAVARLIRLPEDYAIGYMIAVGKGVGNDWPRNRLPIRDWLYTDHF
ncbi:MULTISPECIES: nitroreductase family protein [Acidithiobacillus]|jgi:nitroreductase|uniref:Oxygen-insensitive NAD(P)H nitroreductase / Dihydropteridine reductase n=1 Tax=Acidithiobacillus caldus (strain SM-1) TaxID=990288 RepID=F9ZTU5_ACICS|nr:MULTISPECIES: nitroreductase family protein [Acidithiobacillus]AEK59521.1 Oxygen-insensitive NAD(P)H nitroreductase / Dihydropteridine reductase [Acidithiobacillus caldus SM-1]AUW33881.1 nitroreductase family protein [Acidithiobacillus caldus]MBU2762431.1 nitroreductase family protein [Acidithiobacillus caldus]MBU2769909.1 nitroreductase family protein [Acidithiobacillus caldus]MBU2782368.1 nitroreductase family protein [Acidithiobacillus caldus]